MLEKKDIENYFKVQEQEDIEVIASLIEGIDVLQEDLKKYLIEAGEKFPEEKKEEQHEEGVFEPFKALLSSFKDIFAFLELLKPGEKKEEAGPKSERKEIAMAEKTAKEISEKVYDVFKVTQGFVTAKPIKKGQKPRV